MCVTNTYRTPVSGTLDTSTGAATWSFLLNSATVLTGVPAQPCPICAVSVGGAACVGSPAAPCAGVCDGSPNQGTVCASKNPDGLSSDCPAPAVSAGNQRCYRGANNGNSCQTATDCPGGTCSQFIGNIPVDLNPLTTGTSSLTPLNTALCTAAGAPYTCCTGAGAGNCAGSLCPKQTSTQFGAFKSDICQTGANSGKPCSVATAVADCGAGVTCRLGTLANYCVGGTNDGLGCSGLANAVCGTGGTCQLAGTLAHLVTETGQPTGALAIGAPKAIKLASSFCVDATTNPTVNGNANLPGPGATAVVGTITLLP